MHPTGDEAKKPRWIWKHGCKEWTGNVKVTFHGALLSSMSRTLMSKAKKPSPVCTVCDAGTVHLHYTEPLAVQREGGRCWKRWKCQDNMIQAASGGNKPCRGCALICTCNLHQNEVQPNKPLCGVRKVGATCLLSCRGAWQESVAGGCGVDQDDVVWDVRLDPRRMRAADPGTLCQTGWNRFVLSFVWPDRQRSSSPLYFLQSVFLQFLSNCLLVGGSYLPLFRRI